LPSSAAAASAPVAARFSSTDEEPIIVDRSILLRTSPSPQSSPNHQLGPLLSFSAMSPTSNQDITTTPATTSNRPAMTTSSALQSSDSTYVVIQGIVSTILSSVRHGDFHQLFFVFWDLFKSVLPASTQHLLLQASNSALGQLLGLPPSSTSSSSIHHVSTNGLLHEKQRRRRRRQLQHHHPHQQQQLDIKIVGLPNQGQTCFLNSVLQSLASLEPFLTYLDDITLYQEGLRKTSTTTAAAAVVHGPDFDDDEEGMNNNNNSSSSSSNSRSWYDSTTTQSSFSRQLLTLLYTINSMDNGDDDNDDWEDSNGSYGSSSRSSRFSYHGGGRDGRRRRSVDPKRLLKQIGESNTQFKSFTAEQQDAQELLQTLLSVVIADGQLEHGGGGSGSQATLDGDFSVLLGKIDSIEHGNLMTSAMAAIEDPNNIHDFSNEVDLSNHNGSGNGRINVSVLSHDDGSDVLSLSGFLSIVGEEQKNIAVETNGDSLHSIAAINPRQIPPVGVQEEKKQDHFDYHHVSAVQTNGKEGNTNHGTHHRPNITGKSSWQPPVSTISAHNLLKKVSSITPSPLSGWIGSTIRCCSCNHVRPIRNAPFLDVPLTPTSIPEYLAGAHCATRPTAPNSPRVPSCSLERCLSDFTSIERVSDVECRFCTIQREIQNFEEETMMLRGAVETTEKRILLQTKRIESKMARMNEGIIDSNDIPSPNFQETQHLREELAKVEQRLLQLKTMDPDEDDTSYFDGNPTDSDESGDMFLGLEQRHKMEMERSVAQKCLFFTRTPVILCCHIQRRYYDPFTNRMEKCIQPVRFPQILDMSPYCAYNPRATASWAAGSSSPSSSTDESAGCYNKSMNRSSSKRKLPYRLQSVIEHRGNAFGGHYVSYRRDSTGAWFQISDANVTKVSWQHVQSCQAYMLFYEAV
jgi:Ubiquitin carboxyl-terminal hydrolase